MTEIVRTEGILGGDPRIEGTRIGVLDVYELVVEGDHSPADIADQLNVSIGAIYAALAYYHDHPDELRRVRKRHADAEESLERNALSPPKPVE
ncbi:DUF433 domain-containing protein [Halalkalicoccus sp. NIPERK01]|uniref:DUF433 domain-containing protein n=1 Tax=Halalkalicoccus sp. NIPERK01 TaxID=3053469 RepID=UPI00256EB356|nr:DUF433 domain-containing protein [Halalkalicoccus sp. NIPERK01]MDL5362026.1 DUF433 domain-containing protein [Halalkalicoccus sp. NIPERK01]